MKHTLTCKIPEWICAVGPPWALSTRTPGSWLARSNSIRVVNLKVDFMSLTQYRTSYNVNRNVKSKNGKMLLPQIQIGARFEVLLVTGDSLWKWSSKMLVSYIITQCQNPGDHDLKIQISESPPSGHSDSKPRQYILVLGEK